jgi:hypothetical protein
VLCDEWKLEAGLVDLLKEVLSGGNYWVERKNKQGSRVQHWKPCLLATNRTLESLLAGLLPVDRKALTDRIYYIRVEAQLIKADEIDVDIFWVRELLEKWYEDEREKEG